MKSIELHADYDKTKQSLNMTIAEQKALLDESKVELARA